MPLEKPIVTFAPKVDINLHKGQRPALIAYPGHIKIKSEKINASIVHSVNFPVTHLPKNAYYQRRDTWRDLRKQVRWLLLLVGVQIVQVLETIKYAVVPSFARLERMKKIELAWIVLRVIIPQVVLPFITYNGFF